MAKYRKKLGAPEEVEAIIGWVYDREVQIKRERAMFLGDTGQIFEWPREEFNREYERVEEPPKERLVPCADCGFTVRLVHGVGDGKYYCDKCWANFGKKPKPFTLADLVPGDVFGWGAAGCGERQILNNDYYFNPENEDSLALARIRLTLDARGNERVTFVRHHSITFKQLLWIDASDKVRKALDDSLRDKWLPALTKGGELNGVSDCALCRLFYDDYCGGCIIRAFTGQGACLNTPHPRWDGRGRAINSISRYQEVRDFALWLAEFQPPIHPTRLEVEATPQEWPGKDKQRKKSKKPKGYTDISNRCGTIKGATFADVRFGDQQLLRVEKTDFMRCVLNNLDDIVFEGVVFTECDFRLIKNCQFVQCNFAGCTNDVPLVSCFLDRCFFVETDFKFDNCIQDGNISR